MPNVQYKKVRLENQVIGEIVYDDNEMFVTPEKGVFGTFKVANEEDAISLCKHFHKVIVPNYSEIGKWIIPED